MKRFYAEGGGGTRARTERAKSGRELVSRSSVARFRCQPRHPISINDIRPPCFDKRAPRPVTKRALDRTTRWIVLIAVVWVCLHGARCVLPPSASFVRREFGIRFRGKFNSRNLTLREVDFVLLGSRRMYRSFVCPRRIGFRYVFFLQHTREATRATRFYCFIIFSPSVFTVLRLSCARATGTGPDLNYRATPVIALPAESVPSTCFTCNPEYVVIPSLGIARVKRSTVKPQQAALKDVLLIFRDFPAHTIYTNISNSRHEY